MRTFVYLSQYFKWYIIYFSMIFLNEGIVVLNSIPFTCLSMSVSAALLLVLMKNSAVAGKKKSYAKSRRSVRGRWTFTNYRPLGAFLSVHLLQLIGLTTEHICFFI